MMPRTKQTARKQQVERLKDGRLHTVKACTAGFVLEQHLEHLPAELPLLRLPLRLGLLGGRLGCPPQLHAV